jgi:hypothetical protein
MRFIRASIFIAILALFGSLSLNGCYTQLAVSHDESAYADTQSTPSDQISGPIYTVDPRMYERTPRENYYPLPLSGGAALPGNTTGTQSQSPHRESGYQRSSTPSQDDNSMAQSATTQTPPSGGSNSGGRSSPPASGSDTRTSGTTRSGR